MSIIFHPFLYGSNMDPTARAGFYGLGLAHGRGAPDRRWRAHAPNAEATARYRAAYAEYRRLVQAMQAPWVGLQELERQASAEAR